MISSIIYRGYSTLLLGLLTVLLYIILVPHASAWLSSVTQSITNPTAVNPTLTLSGNWDMIGADSRYWTNGSIRVGMGFNPNGDISPYPTFSWLPGQYIQSSSGSFSISGPIKQGNYTMPYVQEFYGSVGTGLQMQWYTYSLTIGNPPTVTALLNGAPNNIAVATTTTPFTLQVIGTNNPTTCYMSKYTNGVSGAWAAYPCATYTSPTTVSATSLGLNPGLNRIAFYMSNAAGNSSSVTRTITVPSSVPPPDVAFLLNGMPNNITVVASTTPFTLQITGTNNPTACYRKFSGSPFIPLTSYTCSLYASATTTTARALGLTGTGPKTLSAYMVNTSGISPTISRIITIGVQAPIVSSPTVTSIEADSAVLGATVDSDGGDTLTERGICWGTSIGSMTNCNAEGGTFVGIFNELQSGLPINTQIYFRGYATNGIGTGYSSRANFRTSSIPVCTGGVVSNATPYTGDMTDLSSSVSYVYAALDTARKCEYTCNSGYVWNGSRCVVSAIIPTDPVLTVAPRIVEEGTEAILSWDTNNGDETLCSITGGTLGATLASLPSTSGDIETGSYTIPSVTALTTYTLTCGALSDTVTVEIPPRGFET